MNRGIEGATRSSLRRRLRRHDGALARRRRPAPTCSIRSASPSRAPHSPTPLLRDRVGWWPIRLRLAAVIVEPLCRRGRDAAPRPRICTRLPGRAGATCCSSATVRPLRAHRHLVRAEQAGIRPIARLGKGLTAGYLPMSGIVSWAGCSRRSGLISQAHALSRHSYGGSAPRRGRTAPPGLTARTTCSPMCTPVRTSCATCSTMGRLAGGGDVRLRGLMGGIGGPAHRGRGGAGSVCRGRGAASSSGRSATSSCPPPLTVTSRRSTGSCVVAAIDEVTTDGDSS